LDVKKFKIQTLILAPTRELANQIATNLRDYIRHTHNVKVLTLCGGMPFKPQAASLFHGAHIIVGTAGRILKHIKEENIDLSNVKNLVLDEADKMLDMGFYDDILEIINVLPKQRQSMLFSATYEDNIESLASSILTNPSFVEIASQRARIKQTFYKCEKQNRKNLLVPIITQNKAQSILIFANMKIECDAIADFLDELGVDVLTLHSDLDQKERDEVFALFKSKSYPVLIASDVASRGLDVDDIDLVINYELAKDVKIHTHRIGRTARAGKGGIAVNFYDYDEDKVDDIKDEFDDLNFEDVESIVDDTNFKIDSEFRTLFIDAGKKHKLRKGDVIGALTAGIGLNKEDIGIIDSQNFRTYVAIKKEKIDFVINALKDTKIKGKFYRYNKL
jgi:ATP-independent RNA helicase DbpA